MMLGQKMNLDFTSAVDFALSNKDCCGIRFDIDGIPVTIVSMYKHQIYQIPDGMISSG